jgi:hypothetical protein
MTPEEGDDMPATNLKLATPEDEAAEAIEQALRDMDEHRQEDRQTQEPGSLIGRSRQSIAGTLRTLQDRIDSINVKVAQKNAEHRHFIAAAEAELHQARTVLAAYEMAHTSLFREE